MNSRGSVSHATHFYDRVSTLTFVGVAKSTLILVSVLRVVLFGAFMKQRNNFLSKQTTYTSIIKTKSIKKPYYFTSQSSVTAIKQGFGFKRISLRILYVASTYPRRNVYVTYSSPVLNVFFTLPRKLEHVAKV